MVVSSFQFGTSAGGASGSFDNDGAGGTDSGGVIGENCGIGLLEGAVVEAL